MSTTSVIVIVVVAIVVVGALAAAAVVASKASQRRQLKARFGPEYERVVSTTGGDQRRAEVDLRDRVEQRDKITVKPLAPAQRDRYEQDWRQVQATFVDAPSTALGQADSLITSVMVDRGYPMRDFDGQADILSVDHPQVVQLFRQAHGTYVESQRGPVATEEMRQAFVSFRALFGELIEGDEGTPAQSGSRQARTDTRTAD